MRRQCRKMITISPVTRIEGHAKITIQLDDNHDVIDARFHVNEFRGFEKFTEGRLLWEMPGITSRICGICPASHLVTSAKAGDDILAVEIPEPQKTSTSLDTRTMAAISCAQLFPSLLTGFSAGL